MREERIDARIDRPRDFTEDLTRWLEKRLPSGYYGYLEVPIEDGRVSCVKITAKIRPSRKQM